MKLHKKCPECESSEIYTALVSARGGCGQDLLPGVGGLFNGGEFELYVCGKCGYSQFYVPKKMLDDVQKKFSQVKHEDISH
jgi:predicted nucleic-acid-binding Zn-ribbon protein